MSDLVRFTLDDGSEVYFEAGEGDLVAQRSGGADVEDGGRLTERLAAVAATAQAVATTLRSRLSPQEISLELGLKVSADVNWFFAKSQAESTIKVTLKWIPQKDAVSPPATATAGADVVESSGGPAPATS